jgi:uncharacterized membrane protein
MSATRWAARPLLWAATASAISATLLSLTLVHAPESAPKYMGWNLVLAWVPVALAVVLLACVRRGAARPVVIALGVSWLAFLPNAPYLLTDMVHAGTPYGGATRLDKVTLAMFALTGVVMFVAAVVPVSEATRLVAGTRWGRASVPVCAVAASIGMYLGRVLRWNSWDIFARPVSRLESIDAIVRTPAELARAGAFIVVASAVLITAVSALSRWLPSSSWRR